jgi:hypothetical protein
MSSPVVARDSSNPAPLIRVADADHIVGVWGTTLIQIWRGSATSILTAEANRIASALVTSSRHPVSSLYIVERRSPTPDDEARKNLAAFSRDIVSRMSISVVLAEGGGFRSALVRSVGVTLTMILPHSSKFRFVNDVNDAVQLIEPHLRTGNRWCTSSARGRERAARDDQRARLGLAPRLSHVPSFAVVPDRVRQGASADCSRTGLSSMILG